MIQQNFSLNLKLWEYHRHAGDLVLPPHAHAFWQLNLFESGRALFGCDGQPDREAGPGELLFVPPGCRHYFRYFDEPCVGFSFKMVVHGLDDAGQLPIWVVASRENAGCLRAIRELLLSTFPENLIFAGEHVICSEEHYGFLVESLLSGLFRRFVLSDRPESSRLLNRLRQLLQQRHGQPLTVAELARHCRYSPGHLLALTRQEFGFATKELIDRERMMMARHFLEFSQMNIGEIAEHMGFKSAFAFSNFFRLHDGMSPREYRSQLIRSIL